MSRSTTDMIAQLHSGPSARCLRSAIDHGSTWYQSKGVCELDGAHQVLIPDGIKGRWSPPPHWQQITTVAFEQLFYKQTVL